MFGLQPAFSFCLGLMFIAMGVLVSRLRLRRGRHRYAPQVFTLVWRLSMLVLGLVLIGITVVRMHSGVSR
ncbi:MAG TPA: hypothetical protein VH351_18330 [Bryobacteraceae bacterium]|jgi:uncharacterized protein YybS (DUF2232 family)|nr:hypothetical protein [Bryobacteraceae bacterium]